jgi:L-fuculose-phosphate aldolase
MIVATQGNLSARLSSDRFVITRRGRRKGELRTRDFVELGMSDSADSTALLQASSEYRMHQAAYRHRRDAEALLHAHPVALTAFAVRGATPDFARFDEAREFVGPIALVPYLPSGTSTLAEAAAHALGGPGRPSLILLQNHGALSAGQSVDEALARLEVAEHLAATILLAERRG